MIKNTSEEYSFNVWREKYPDSVLITDGIIDTELWKNSKIKILFLLKEAYGKKRHLPDYINQSKAKGRTFIPLAQWAYAIQEITKKKKLSIFSKNKSIINPPLLSSAVINIKKVNGKKSSDNKDLVKYVNENWEEIKKQINTINPDIIVCGNTWSLIHSKLQDSTVISDRVYKTDNYIFIDFWHPANRTSNIMNYYALSAIYLQYIETINSTPQTNKSNQETTQ